MSRKHHDRWVTLVYPNGHAKTIRRTEAQEMLQDGAVEYGGEKNGRTCVLIKTVYDWRKTTRMVMGETDGDGRKGGDDRDAACTPITFSRKSIGQARL